MLAMINYKKHKLSQFGVTL